MRVHLFGKRSDREYTTLSDCQLPGNCQAVCLTLPTVSQFKTGMRVPYFCEIATFEWESRACRAVESSGGIVVCAGPPRVENPRAGKETACMGVRGAQYGPLKQRYRPGGG